MHFWETGSTFVSHSKAIDLYAADCRYLQRRLQIFSVVADTSALWVTWRSVLTRRRQVDHQIAAIHVAVIVIVPFRTVVGSISKLNSGIIGIDRCRLRGNWGRLTDRCVAASWRWRSSARWGVVGQICWSLVDRFLDHGHGYSGRDAVYLTHVLAKTRDVRVRVAALATVEMRDLLQLTGRPVAVVSDAAMSPRYVVGPRRDHWRPGIALRRRQRLRRRWTRQIWLGFSGNDDDWRRRRSWGCQSVDGRARDGHRHRRLCHRHRNRARRNGTRRWRHVSNQ